jgi:DNA anti-recombination protein RmuC
MGTSENVRQRMSDNYNALDEKSKAQFNKAFESVAAKYTEFNGKTFLDAMKTDSDELLSILPEVSQKLQEMRTAAKEEIFKGTGMDADKIDDYAESVDGASDKQAEFTNTSRRAQDGTKGFERELENSRGKIVPW